METSRKRKADTVLVGFMGHAILGAQNMTSCESIPGRDTWPSLALAPTLDETMRRASEIETRHLRCDWSDSMEGDGHAYDSWCQSRQWLTERGYLP